MEVMKQLPTGLFDMRHYMYPHRSYVVVFAAAWIVFSIAVLGGIVDVTYSRFTILAILQAVVVILLRFIDPGEIVFDARGGWKGI